MSDTVEASACLVEVHGRQPGRRVDLGSAPCTIGRAETNSLSIDHPSISRHHAVIRWERGDHCVRDLGSTNGTFVNESRVRVSRLGHGDLLRLGGTTFRTLVASDLEAACRGALRRLEATDTLTQVLNRAAFLALLDRRLRAARGPISVVVMELDRLPDLTASFSPAATDRLLSLLPGLLEPRLRRRDVLGRVEPHRFALLLSDTPARVAERLAHRLKAHVALSRFQIDRSHPVVSLRTWALTVEPGQACPAPELVDRAAAALAAGA